MKIHKNRTIDLRLTALITCVFLFGFTLNFMRSPSPDDCRYLRDTAVIAKCISNGNWFGNESVGEHGFLFKIPSALLIMIFGQSVFVATLPTIFLAMGCCWLAYHIFRRLLHSRTWAILGTLLLATNMQFLISLPSYLREIPLLFAVLTLMYMLTHKGTRWQVGMALFLILEAKESSFFVFAPAILIWILQDEWQLQQHKWKPFVRQVFARATAAFLPAAVWIILMFSTSAIPVNMWNATILNLTTRNMNYQLKHFRPDLATDDIWEGNRPAVQINFGDSETAGSLPAKAINYILAYGSKFFFVQTFSYSSIPKLLAIPALIMSIILFRRRRRKYRYNIRPLAIMLWTYILVFTLRKSHARYMIPAIPLLITFGLYFFRFGLNKTRLGGRILITLPLLIAIGSYFDPNIKKVAMSAILLFTMWGAYVLRNRNSALSRRLAHATVMLLCCFTFLYWLQFTIKHRYGQIGPSIALGNCREMETILKQFDLNEGIWVNDIKQTSLAQFYRSEPRKSAEWHWTLKDWVPKKHLLREHPILLTHTFHWRKSRVDRFRTDIRKSNVRRIGLTVTHNPKFYFSYQSRLDELRDANWLALERVVPLKNKDLYIFRVHPRTAPRNNQSVPEPPSYMRVRFNDDINYSSLSASDIRIDGIPASSVRPINAQTAEFDIHPTTEGAHEVSIEDAAILYVNGTPVGEYKGSFTVDLTHPYVKDSSIRNGDILSANDMGPTNSLDFSITFSEPMGGFKDHYFLLRGKQHGPIWPAGYSYDDNTLSLTVKYTALGNDNYTMTLFSGDNRVDDMAGNCLVAAPDTNSINSPKDKTPADFIVHFKIKGLAGIPNIEDK